MKDTSSVKLAFDTNIWIYLLDKKSPFYNLVKSVFSRVEKDYEIIITQQNLLEILDTLLIDYKLLPTDAIKKIQLILDHKITLIQPRPQTLATFLNLAESTLKRRNNFDLYLGATLLDNGVTTLITNDKKGFKGIKNLQVLLLEEFIS
jgi:predicted nucleic acid-binding protein